MKFQISLWNTNNMYNMVSDVVAMWRDLGITVAISPSYNKEDKYKILEILDEAYNYGIKVILWDYRTHWRVMNEKGEEEYRRLTKEAYDDFGHHEAVFGFYVGDEPNATDSANAFAALKIHSEIAPELTAFLNLLPWFEWIGEIMGTSALAPYLDRVKNEGDAKLLAYDCYTQLWEGESGYDVYFNNLREYYLATLRLNVPYWNTVLSCSHYYYRIPSKDDFIWQLNTSVAHGAAGVAWFYIHLTEIWENERDAPINPLGEKTETFKYLAEVNKLFNGYCGEIISELKIDKCYHVEKAYGGNELFTPSGNVLSVCSNNKVPLIFSRFKDKENRNYYVVCCNSTDKCTRAIIQCKETVKLEKCMFGNRFEQTGNPNIDLWLSPGQLVLLREA